MLSPAYYYNVVAKPTNASFFERNRDVRLGMIASTVTFHVLDYLAQARSATPKAGDKLLERLQAIARSNAAFKVVEGFALASKHSRLSRKGLEGYASSQQLWRAPAICGRAIAGRTMAGDAIGGISVILPDGGSANLTASLRQVEHYYESIFPELADIEKAQHER